MSTFVLIAGAWEGGWLWRRVAPLLRAAGHEVFTPTLTGLGERAHLLSRSVDLETHIADVLGVLKWERLEGVTLVGHSYSGMVVTGAADRAPERIGALIYLDAFVPEDGQSLFSLSRPDRADAFRKMAEEHGEGWYIPALPAAFWHVHEPDLAEYLEALSTPHPIATMAQPVRLAGDGRRIARKAYVIATGYEPSAFPRFAEAARAQGWPVEELATHHFPMLSMPRETAEALIRHAA